MIKPSLWRQNNHQYSNTWRVRWISNQLSILHCYIHQHNSYEIPPGKENELEIMKQAENLKTVSAGTCKCISVGLKGEVQSFNRFLTILSHFCFIIFNLSHWWDGFNSANGDMVLMRPQKSLKDGVFIGVPTFYLEMYMTVRNIMQYVCKQGPWKEGQCRVPK